MAAAALIGDRIAVVSNLKAAIEAPEAIDTMSVEQLRNRVRALNQALAVERTRRACAQLQRDLLRRGPQR